MRSTAAAIAAVVVIAAMVTIGIAVQLCSPAALIPAAAAGIVAGLVLAGTFRRTPGRRP